jgi:O-antigen ligase
VKLKEHTGADGDSPGQTRKPTPTARPTVPAFSQPRHESAPRIAPTRADVGKTLFAGAVGLWLGLAMLKFGTPVVLGERVEPPEGFLEIVLTGWPVTWGYWILGGLVLAGLPLLRWQVPKPLWLATLPLVWFTWQVCSGIQTVNPALTKPVLAHFAACVLSFYLGLLILSSLPRLRLYWVGLFGSFLVVLIVGWQQHFGGIEATRRFFYEMPNWQEFPPEFIKKLNSDRIYSTLFYPNTLAGVVLLLLPGLLTAAWELAESISGKWIVSGIVGIGGLACLYWSGSKGGWLIALVLAVIAFLHLNLSLRLKLGIAAAIAVVGLSGFLVAYSGYLSKGATSVSARMDYWKAGLKLLLEKPILGSGPGTYQAGYLRLKAPEAEMTRLAHNDYLQQASDSGIMGGLLYGGMIGGMLFGLYRGSRAQPTRFAAWLGLLGIAIQSLIEFGLYIPATAWIQFLFMGWLFGSDPAHKTASRAEA